VAIDGSGNLFIATGVVRKVAPNGIISTYAGNPDAGSSGDGGPATAAELSASAIAVDGAGNLYIADDSVLGSSRIRKVDVHGTITTLAGTSQIDADILGIAADAAGNVYVVDDSDLLRKVDTAGNITTLAGLGSSLNDNIPAVSASLGYPSGVAVDSSGNIYVIDANRYLLRKVSANGIITTVAGQGGATYSGNGGQALQAGIASPWHVAVDGAGNIYLTERLSGFAESSGDFVRMITPAGIIRTIAGTGNPGFSGDGGPGTSAELDDPLGIAASAAGNVYIADSQNYRVRLVTTSSSAPYTCTNTAAPTIASVDSASAYGGYSYFASGSWLEIKGTNLADPNDPRLSAANPGQWTSTDFNGSNAPTSLDGISVSINGKPAYVWYLSPTQLNVQAPEDSATGNVAITVTNCHATSSQFDFSRRTLAPGLLAPPTYSSGGKQYLVATFASDGAYVLSTSLGASFGLNSRPAQPGDVLVAYGIGFGDVTPSILPGVIAGQSNKLTNPVVFSFGSTSASLEYSGLAGGFVGLYEFYITVPSGLASGDYEIGVTQNGVALPQTLYLTVQAATSAVSGFAGPTSARISSILPRTKTLSPMARLRYRQGTIAARDSR
jgi:uncharacterized protein (TIGR03437 family)